MEKSVPEVGPRLYLYIIHLQNVDQSLIILFLILSLLIYVNSKNLFIKLANFGNVVAKINVLCYCS